MSSSQNKEIDAFIVLLATFDLEHAVLALSDPQRRRCTIRRSQDDVSSDVL